MSDRPPSPPTRRRPVAEGGSPNVLVADEQGPDGAGRHPVDLERWADLARAVLEREGVPGDAELSVVFVDEPSIAALNEQYMASSGPTDVLAFPIDGAEPQPSSGELPALLGDVVICPSVAASNASEHAGTYDDEIALLVVHGVLHLLGHDHAEPDERDRMQQRERDLLTELHGELSRNPWP